jgi:heme-degrading monooxygenase HmoA
VIRTTLSHVEAVAGGPVTIRVRYPRRSEVTMAVLSFVSARINADRQDEVARQYTRAVESGLPPGIRQTLLLVGDDGTVAIATVWKSREDLDAMRSSGEEPLARRLLREAGGEPEARFFEIAAESPAQG